MTVSTKLSLTRLHLSNFRNYESQTLEVSEKPVILTGLNGAGKTNILEAISLLVPGRGFRRAALSEMSGAGKSWAISANILKGADSFKIGTALDTAENTNDKRIVKIDEKPAKSHMDLAGRLSIVWLIPQMDQLFMEGGTARRKFIDRLVYNFDAEHASRVSAYETSMRERNRLLSEPRADPLWLDVLETKMAELGTAISIARCDTVLHINEMIMTAKTPFPKGKISLLGLVEDALNKGQPALQIENKYREVLAEGRRVDAESGRTSVGAHRTQVVVKYIEKNMNVEQCSTGEQKAMLLSIVLAEARAGANWHGVVPILLLDEVVAHLDEGRRNALFEEIINLGAQAWLTGTDKELFSGIIPHANHLKIACGKVEKVHNNS